jgi:hypothetical protein
MRLPHTISNFGWICGIYFFVEFDFNVVSIHFLIIGSYLDCIDISVNTKNYASRKLPVLRNVALYYALQNSCERITTQKRGAAPHEKSS